MFYISTLVLALVAPAIPGTPDIKLMAKADFFPEKVSLDLSGYYTCEGQEGPDKRYKGVAVITKKGDTYLIQWVLGSGLNFNGIAVRVDDTLSAGWSLPVGDKGTLVRGVNVYRIEPGPRLIGRWAVTPGDGTLRAETLTFLKKIDE